MGLGPSKVFTGCKLLFYYKLAVYKCKPAVYKCKLVVYSGLHATFQKIVKKRCYLHSVQRSYESNTCKPEIKYFSSVNCQFTSVNHQFTSVICWFTSVICRITSVIRRITCKEQGTKLPSSCCFFLHLKFINFWLPVLRRVSIFISVIDHDKKNTCSNQTEHISLLNSPIPGSHRYLNMEYSLTMNIGGFSYSVVRLIRL